MNAQHTPGPYEYRRDRTIAAQGVPLARCYAGDRNAENNGPLFAAAAELLEAGLMLLAAADEGDADKAMDGYDALRAAIAKAEGRS